MPRGIIGDLPRGRLAHGRAKHGTVIIDTGLHAGGRKSVVISASGIICGTVMIVPHHKSARRLTRRHSQP